VVLREWKGIWYPTGLGVFKWTTDANPSRSFQKYVRITETNLRDKTRKDEAFTKLKRADGIKESCYSSEVAPMTHIKAHCYTVGGRVGAAVPNQRLEVAA